MTIRRAAISCAAVFAAVAGVAGATPSATFTDASGDAGTSGDITTVTVANDSGGNYTFTVRIPNWPTVPADGQVAIGLDTDENAATGAPGTSLGVEFVMIFDGSTQAFSLGRWVGNALAAAPHATAQLAYSGGLLSFSINRSELDNSGGFNFWVETSHGAAAPGQFDDAPDEGTWNYRLGTSPPPPPPPPPPPAQRATGIAATPAAPARAGKRFSLTILTRFSDKSKRSPDKVRCTARVGKAAVKTAAKANPVAAICSLSVPKKSRGKTLVVTVTVTVATQTLKKSFSFKIK